MTKVVINSCYGGFSLTEKAAKRLRELNNTHALEAVLTGEHFSDGTVNDLPFSTDMVHMDIPRDDPNLIQVLEELGSKECSGSCAALCIVEIPDNVKWHVEEYDGLEWVAEDHRTWGPKP